MNMYEKLLEVSNRLGLKKLILHDKNDNKDYVKKVLTSGFFMQAAKLYGNQYMTILGGDKKLMSLDSDNISMDEKPEWIIYSKCIQTRNKYTLLNVTSIDPQSLVERNLSFFTRLIKMNKHDDNNNPAITDLENIQLKIKELSDGW